jgi:hypothetical protein
VAKDTTKTVERVLTKEEVARAIDKVELSPEEELVVRLRYGIGLEPDARLEYRGKGNEELEARLALIEKAILDMLEDGVPQQADRSVLDKFKDL